MGKYALVVNNLVTNIVVWDGVEEFHPENIEARVSLISSPLVKKNDSIVGVSTYTHKMIADGNSLARGQGLNFDGALYTAILEAGETKFEYLNKAVNGTTTTTMITNGAVRVDAFFNGALPAGKNILLVWEITNDIAAGNSESVCYNNIKAYCQARKDAGWKVIVGTVLPRTTLGEGFETTRTNINASIRSALLAGESWLDAVADVGNDPIIGIAGANLNTEYYSDGIHLTFKGHRIAANYFKAAINLIK